MPQAVGWWLKSGADRAIISKQLGDAVLGNFSLAFQLASLILISASVLNLALVPELNRLLKDNQEKLVINYIKRGALFIAFIFISIFIVGHLIITKFYLGDYSLSLDIFHLLAFALIPQALMLLVISVLYFKGEGGFVAKLIFFSFLFQVVVNYFNVQFFGINGLIINSLVVNVFVFTWVVIKSKKLLENR